MILVLVQKGIIIIYFELLLSSGYQICSQCKCILFVCDSDQVTLSINNDVENRDVRFHEDLGDLLQINRDENSLFSR